MKEYLRQLSNVPGWNSKRKLVIIESDDWGSIRMPSNQTRETLLGKGIDLFQANEAYRYSLNDTLAGSEDMDALFSVLRKHRDINGNHPVFTAISLVANPDFEAIRRNNFESYHFESIESTFKKYNLDGTLKVWKQGESEKIFIPEFHGREHLNVAAWMRRLQGNEEVTRFAFDHGMWAIGVPNLQVNYQAAFDLEFARDLEDQKKIVVSGLELFNSIHKRKARFFVPPNGPINNKVFEPASRLGIDYISTAKIQKEVYGENRIKRRFHWLGQKNAWKQRYLTRNCFFEPSDPTKDWVASCLQEIEVAFQFNKPAVISSHRVNFIGRLNEKNRGSGLSSLNTLLREMTKRWPDIEFISSVELGDLMQDK